MAKEEQFKGLDMGQLIGEPISAAAQVQRGNTAMNFIENEGLDLEGKESTVEFAHILKNEK